MTPPERRSMWVIWAALMLALVGALALALLAFSGPAHGAAPAQRGNRLLDTLERENGLPSGLLLAVCRIESGCRNVTATGRGRAGLGADVGPWQIHVPDWKSHAGQRAWWYLRDRAANAAVAAMLLARSRDRCRATIGAPAACLRCSWALYNARSQSWCAKLRTAMGGNV